MPEFVVLYSTLERTWAQAYPTQLALIERLSGVFGNKPYLAVHIWRERYGRGRSETASPPPQKLLDASKASVVIVTSQNGEPYYPQFRNIEYFIKSTKIAFEGANNLYSTLNGGKTLPPDTLILRLRPDVVIDRVGAFPTFCPSATYISMHNTIHRKWDESNPEAGDLVALLHSSTLAQLLKTCDGYDSLEKIYAKYIAKGRRVSFNEQYLYALLEEAGISVVNDPAIRVGMLCQNGNIPFMQPDTP